MILLAAARKRAADRLTLLRAGGPPLWVPNEGVQAAALLSEADVLFYGGAAGGGKSDLLLGLGLQYHKRSIIFRREYKQLEYLEERSREIVGNAGTYNGAKMHWRVNGRFLQFGAVQHGPDVDKFQGHPHDFKGFDEIGHFLEAQFRFLCGWLRTTDVDQRCRIVACGNPPTNAEGEWVIRYWSPWLDEHHPNPAVPGELRWFAMLDGEDTEVDGGEPFEYTHKTSGITEVISPLSRTFIPAKVQDNPYYMASGYVQQLQALPEPLRSMMLEGNFGASQEDDAWQIIPTAWIKAAMDRYKTRPVPTAPMDALGVDVARGGKDKTVLTARYGTWFAPPLSYPGKATPDGPAVAALVAKALVGEPKAQVQIDVIGVGTSPYDTLRSNGFKVIPLAGSNKSSKRDRSGRLGFSNKRAAWAWGLREALDPDHGEDLALPPDRELLADLVSMRWKLVSRGIQVEPKEDIIDRIGRSPDKGESLIYAHAKEHAIRKISIVGY